MPAKISTILAGKIPLDGDDFNVINFKSIKLDCSSLFLKESAVQNGDSRRTYSILHTHTTNVLNLNVLDLLRVTTEGQFDFLPEKIYVRDCMKEIFNAIVTANDPARFSVIFGSPGVGKSVLTFLAALCVVRYIEKPVLFLRKTSKQNENISVFWITLSNDGKLNVLFDRRVGVDNSLATIFREVKKKIFPNAPSDDDELDAYTFPKNHFRIICDGPPDGSPDHVEHADLVTSGGYKTRRQEAQHDVNGLPLSAWTLKETVAACRNLFRVQASKVKEAFFFCGGSIGMITQVFGGEVDLAAQKGAIDKILSADGSMDKLRLAYESTELSGDQNSIDRFRSMFALTKESGREYKTVQFVGSPYLLQRIRFHLSIEDTLKGLSYAKKSGIQSLYGWHFELFGHKVFQEMSKRQVWATPPSGHQLPSDYRGITIREGHGTGAQSVNQLDSMNTYWTPSTSNFANIDAAIGIDDTLYCIQYTVSTSHAFNFHTFEKKFLEQLPEHFQQSFTKITILFVVPSGTTFKKAVIPVSQQNQISNMTFRNGILPSTRSSRTEKEEDQDAMDTDSEDNMWDDDCSGEGFDESEDDQAASGSLRVHFYWEELNESYDSGIAPLSFLKFPSST